MKRDFYISPLFSRNTMIIAGGVVGTALLGVLTGYLSSTGQLFYAVLIGFAIPIILLAIIVVRQRRLFPFALVFILALDALTIPNSGVFTISRIGVSALLIASIIAYGIQKPFVTRKIILPLLAWSVYSIFSIVWSIDPQLTILRIITLVSLLISVWMIINFINTHEDFCVFLDALITFGIIDSLITIAQSFTLIPLFGKSGGGLLLDPNQNALQIGIALILAMAYWVLPSLQNRFFRPGLRLLLVLSILVLGMLATLSRGGAISAAVGSIGMILILSGTHKRKQATLLAFVIIAISILVVRLFPTLFEILLGRISLLPTDQFGYRLPIWTVAWRAFLQQPWIGYGFATFPTLDLSITGRASVTHNTFLTLLVDGGILGSAIFLLMIVGIVLTLVKSLSSSDHFIRERATAMASVLILAATMMGTLDLMYFKSLWLLIGLVAAVFKSIKKISGISPVR
jgi:O-antigen ligase